MTVHGPDDNLPPGLTSAHEYFYPEDIPDRCPECGADLDQLLTDGGCPHCGEILVGDGT